MTNVRNPKSPKALAKFQSESAAAAQRASEEKVKAEEQAEKARLRKQSADALANAKVAKV